LQKLDFYNNPEITKNIINFYAKARAMKELSAFYDICATHEIDDFRDYEKALEALREALKYLIKSKEAPDRNAKLNSLEARIKVVEKFVTARKLIKTTPAEFIKICSSLLETPDLDTAIRVGDVYAELIGYYMQAQQMQQAYALVQRMRAANIVLDPYLAPSLVETIHAGVGVPMPGSDAKLAAAQGTRDQQNPHRQAAANPAAAGAAAAGAGAAAAGAAAAGGPATGHTQHMIVPDAGDLAGDDVGEAIGEDVGGADDGKLTG